MNRQNWADELDDFAAQARGRARRSVEEQAPPLERLFRRRLGRIYESQVEFELEFHRRPTRVAMGRYYRSRRLIRIYAVDADEGERSVEELFEVFLHELAHHLEYHEPDRFGGECQREHGRAHSPLFHHIWETLRSRWAKIAV